eukprot:1773635-Pyramimonas_sp.AAC.1
MFFVSSRPVYYNHVLHLYRLAVFLVTPKKKKEKAWVVAARKEVEAELAKSVEKKSEKAATQNTAKGGAKGGGAKKEKMKAKGKIGKK